MGSLGNRYKQWDSGDAIDGLGVRVIDIRVFIYGVEVTEHLMSGYNRSRPMRDSEGTCSFTLDNNYQKFVLRSENFNYKKDWQEKAHNSATWNSKLLDLGTRGDEKFIGDGIASNGGYFLYHENAKRDLYARKQAANKSLRDTYLSETGVEYPSTYRLNVGEIVIHRMDHVCVWILDPLLDPAEVASGDVKALRWVPDFTGFVDLVEKQEDQTTGASSLQINCVDIKNMMKRKRALLNPDISISASPDPQNNIAGVFSNIVKHSANGVATTNVFANMGFDKTVAYLLCNVREDAGLVRELENTFISNGYASMKTFEKKGNFRLQPDMIKARREALEDKGAQSGGLGGYAIGHVSLFPAEADSNQSIKTRKQKVLSDWYALTTFGVNRTWYTDDEVTYIGSETHQQGKFSAFSRFVHFLMPTEGVNFNNVIERIMFDSLGVDREYTNIFEIINGMCGKIDYVMQVNGMGDIMFEFPMYDFLPEYVEDDDDFKYVYAVGNMVSTSNVNDESESNPVTCLEVTGSYVDQTSANAEAGIPDEKVKQLQYTVYVKSDALAVKYGPLLDNYDCPHLTPIGASNADENKVKLAIFGVIEFTKRLAAMSSLQIEAAYNPLLYPNRPLISFYDRRIGLIDSADISLTMRQSATSSVDLTMVRRFDDKGKCSLITGFENTPFSYYAPDSTLASMFSTNGFGSYQDLRSKYGIEVYIADRTNVGSGNDGLQPFAGSMAKGTAPPTMESIEAINELARKHGGTPKMYTAMLFNESSMDPTIVNPDTIATGVFQLMPSSWDDLYANKDLLASLGSPIPTPIVGGYPQYNGGKSNSRQAWSMQFRSAYPTVADQVRVWDAYLTLAEYRAAKGNASQIDKYRIKNAELLGIAQFKPSKLDNYVDSGGDRDTTDMTEKERAQNPGYTNAADYGPAVERKRSKQADVWMAAANQPSNDNTSNVDYVRQMPVVQTPANDILKDFKPKSDRDVTAIGGSGV